MMEVLIATAIAGLVIAGGFRLIAMSYRLLGELEAEREIITATQKVWLRFRLDPQMPDSGTDEESGITWRSDKQSVMVDEYELKYRRVTVSIPSGRSAVIYVPE